MWTGSLLLAPSLGLHGLGLHGLGLLLSPFSRRRCVAQGACLRNGPGSIQSNSFPRLWLMISCYQNFLTRLRVGICIIISPPPNIFPCFPPRSQTVGILCHVKQRYQCVDPFFFFLKEKEKILVWSGQLGLGVAVPAVLSRNTLCV